MLDGLSLLYAHACLKRRRRYNIRGDIIYHGIDLVEWPDTAMLKGRLEGMGFDHASFSLHTEGMIDFWDTVTEADAGILMFPKMLSENLNKTGFGFRLFPKLL